MQQRAQNSPHMRIVVDDNEAQPVEIDANHAEASPAKISMACRRGKDLLSANPALPGLVPELLA